MQFLAPETRVLTRELLWKPLVDLQVGEVLWASIQSRYGRSRQVAGEGHISLKQGSTKSIVLGLSQRKGPVLERAKEVLRRECFSITGFTGGGTNGDVTNLQLMGGLHEKLRALGLFRPQRLMDKLLKSHCDFEVWLRPDPIVTIEALGPPDLFGIKTTTGTFFAEGFAALSGEPAAS